MPRTALVLGAGGIAGQAYQAGVLAALENDLGWDPRAADIIVGSSAGSVTATLLRLGVPAHDLAAFAVEADLSVDGARVLGHFDTDRPELPGLNPRDLLRPWRLPSAALVARAARRPWAVRPMAITSALLPAGRVDITEIANQLSEVAGDEWPPGLWICAARRSDGGRVVFGREGSPPVPLASAVAASCAIPGYFSPVEIGGIEYLDGGVHSSTNADALRHEELDLVIVVASMSAAHGIARTADAPMRWSAHRRIDQELAAFRANGATVVRFEPARRSLAAMGLNAMADDRSDRIVQAAFFEAGRHAARPRMRARLAPLVRARADAERAAGAA
jgi:NTE family protein